MNRNKTNFDSSIKRREFLKLSGAGLLAFSRLPKLLSPDHPLSALLDESNPTLGRVTENSASLFDAPSRAAKRIKSYYKDIILPISGVTIGDDIPIYNRVWYKINDEGYIHSGTVQPVEIVLNAPDFTIPTEGRLAQVTVPFTDAVEDPRLQQNVLYRFYYGTTVWIINAYHGGDADDWYLVQDDYFKMSYYVNAQHLHFLRPDEIAPITPELPKEAKRIEVRLGEQVIIAYENDQAVFVSRVATGAEWKHGVFYTPLGRHYIHHKRPSRHMTSGSPENPVGYDLPGVPWVSYINDKGISFHGTYWHNDFGHPRSHGCINLPISAAQWIFRWTLPEVGFGESLKWTKPGTRVDIF
jgi:hypothetical protein